MRYLTFFFLLFFFPSIDAQNINNSIEFSTHQKQKLVNRYSCFFKTMEDQKRLFRIGLSSYSRVPGIVSRDLQPISWGVEIGVEQRIFKGFSINYSGRVNSISFFHLVDQSDLEEPILDFSNLVSFRNSIGFKKYINKQKQIEQGLSGNNLSGFYIGVQGEINHWNLYLPGAFVIIDEEWLIGNQFSVKGRNTNLILTGGWQQQFAKNGFINFNLNVGRTWQSKKLDLLRYDENDQLQPLPSAKKWLVDYRLSFGWAFGKKKSYNPTDCSILQYFEEEKYLWKFDLLNAVRHISDKAIAGSISVEFEQKLGNAPFSINPFLRLPYTLVFDKESTSFLSVVAGTEFRYYYNLKKRIRQGKTGNNLFANYFGTKLEYITNTTDNLPYGYGIMWGLQRRLFNKVYFDWNIGYQRHTNLESPELSIANGETISEFKIGIAL